MIQLVMLECWKMMYKDISLQHQKTMTVIWHTLKSM